MNLVIPHARGNVIDEAILNRTPRPAMRSSAARTTSAAGQPQATLGFRANRLTHSLDEREVTVAVRRFDVSPHALRGRSRQSGVVCDLDYPTFDQLPVLSLGDTLIAVQRERNSTFAA